MEIREAFLTDAALFILGAAGLYSANFIGALPGSEILLFPLLPVLLLSQGKRAFDRQYLLFYILAGVGSSAPKSQTPITASWLLIG